MKYEGGGMKAASCFSFILHPSSFILGCVFGNTNFVNDLGRREADAAWNENDFRSEP
jgi:hypothetical protein